MADSATIRAAFQRSVQILTRRPALGQKTDVTRVRVHDGLTCEIEDGDWKLTADLATKSGGNGRGPTPGVFGRAAFGSCLAMCYVMWAAELNVPLTGVEVEVQADSDVRGMYGVDHVSPGYQELRYIVSLTSPASHADIVRVLNIAEAHSPYLGVFRQPQHIKREVRINPLEG